MNRATVLYPDWDRLGRDGRFDVSEGKLADPAFFGVIATVEFPDDVEDNEALDNLFERFNIGDRAGVSCRSMSVGDVVLFERSGAAEAYICKPAGWDTVDTTPFVELTK